MSVDGPGVVVGWYLPENIYPFRKMIKFTAQIVSQTYETHRT